MATFRVFYAGGATIDVDAETPAEARQKAEMNIGGIITKVKRVKEPRNASH